MDYPILYKILRLNLSNRSAHFMLTLYVIYFATYLLLKITPFGPFFTHNDADVIRASSRDITKPEKTKGQHETWRPAAC